VSLIILLNIPKRKKNAEITAGYICYTDVKLDKKPGPYRYYSTSFICLLTKIRRSKLWVVKEKGLEKDEMCREFRSGGSMKNGQQNNDKAVIVDVIDDTGDNKEELHKRISFHAVI
jgi:hypothetical protein